MQKLLDTKSVRKYATFRKRMFLSLIEASIEYKLFAAGETLMGEISSSHLLGSRKKDLRQRDAQLRRAYGTSKKPDSSMNAR